MPSDAKAARIVHAIKGWPAKGRMFLRGMPLDPPRAQMMATTDTVTPH